MNKITISQKIKHKHVSHYSIIYIIDAVNKFIHSAGKQKRNIGKTHFLKSIAAQTGASFSTIYNIINQASITLVDYHLKEYSTLSADSVFSKRYIPNYSNRSNVTSANDFIVKVVLSIKNNPLTSIKEAVHSLHTDYPNLFVDSNSVVRRQSMITSILMQSILNPSFFQEWYVENLALKINHLCLRDKKESVSNIVQKSLISGRSPDIGKATK